MANKKTPPKPALLIRGLDRSAPGSYRIQTKLLELLDAAQAAEESQDQRTIVRVGVEIFKFIESRAYCEDGSDPVALLDLMSAEEMDALARNLAGMVGR